MGKGSDDNVFRMDGNKASQGRGEEGSKVWGWGRRKESEALAKGGNGKRVRWLCYPRGCGWDQNKTWQGRGICFQQFRFSVGETQQEPHKLLWIHHFHTLNHLIHLGNYDQDFFQKINWLSLTSQFINLIFTPNKKKKKKLPFLHQMNVKTLACSSVGYGHYACWEAVRVQVFSLA